MPIETPLGLVGKEGASGGWGAICISRSLPGGHIVRVHCVNNEGTPAHTHLHVTVEQRPDQ